MQAKLGIWRWWISSSDLSTLASYCILPGHPCCSRLANRYHCTDSAWLPCRAARCFLYSSMHRGTWLAVIGGFGVPASIPGNPQCQRNRCRQIQSLELSKWPKLTLDSGNRFRQGREDEGQSLLIFLGASWVYR